MNITFPRIYVVLDHKTREEAQQEMLELLHNIDYSLQRLANCVKKDHHSHGDKWSISSKHWNDGGS